MPLPECLDTLLHATLLPSAKRDQSAVFREELARDERMQAVLAKHEPKLKAWFHFHAASMKGAHVVSPHAPPTHPAPTQP